VITRELVRGWTRAAVLAAEIVPGVNVAAGELGFAPAEADERGETHHRRNRDARRHGPHFAIGNLDDLGLFEDNELYRPTPANHVERLKRGIQQQYVFEEILTPLLKNKAKVAVNAIRPSSEGANLIIA